jgi:hypothetical protein
MDAGDAERMATIAKPFSMSSLVRKVDEVLNGTARPEIASRK